MESYLPIFICTLLTVLILLGLLLASRLLRQRNSPLTDREPYECGNEPETFAHEHRFSVRYYLIAVLFVIFDVETIFLFPWAVLLDRLALFGLIVIFLFLIILIAGYVFVWRREALDWV